MRAERVVHARMKLADDLELHVSTLTNDAGVFADIREFVSSLNQYGRGMTFPHELLGTVQKGLVAAKKGPES